MACLTRCVAALALLATAARGASHASANIAGYAPGSNVEQHNRIDLDQKRMETHLGATPPDFTNAKKIYDDGAHSGAYARVTVSPLPAGGITKGDAVTQAGNSAATGKVKKDKAESATEFDISYTSTCVDNTAADTHNTAACFTTAGAYTVGTKDVGTPSAVVNKYRTLAGFSTAAGSKMLNRDGSTQPTFAKYKAYYGNDVDYADKYVQEALAGTGRFASRDTAARIQGVKKGSAYLNVWMYVIREMEDAIDDCRAACATCNDDAVHAWDEAVAFYTGSLQGTTATSGAGSGKLLYALANKRCANFMTCGAAGNDRTSNSQVNIKIFEQFVLGRDQLQQGQCDAGKATMDKIIPQMAVPMIQGAIRYAWKVAIGNDGSKAQAEGAVFAAAVLPLVHSCSSAHAKTISDNMKIELGGNQSDWMSGASAFAAVKSAFESTYPCIGITCADVGGVWLSGTDYQDNAGPCTDPTTTASEMDGASGAGLAASAIVLCVVALAAR